MDPQIIFQGLTVIIVGGMAVFFIKRSITSGAESTAKSISDLGNAVTDLKAEVGEVKDETQEIAIHLTKINGRIGTVESNLGNHKEFTKEKFQGVHARIKEVKETFHQETK